MIKLIVRWLGNSALEIRAEKNILIDPSFKYQPVTDPDIILITHEHDDHIDPEVVQEYSNSEVYAPLSVFEDFSLEGEIVEAGDTIAEDIQVLDIDCYNSRTSVAYFYNGIYQTGDAAVFPQPDGNVRVLFTACFPDFYSQYIDSCKTLDPDLVIPYHFDPEDKQELEAARELINQLEKENFDTRILQIGQEILV